MRQGVQGRAGLSTEELAEVRELWDFCNKNEQIEIKLNWGTLTSRPIGITNDFLYYENDRVIGFLAIYSFLSTEVEISGMVHPDARRQGIFGQLVQIAIEECRRREIPKLIFINERGSTSGKAFLTNLEARYSFSEYVMELKSEGTEILSTETQKVQIRPAVKEDVELLVQLNVSGFTMTETDAREYVLQTIEGDKELTWIAELGEDRIPVGKIGAMIEADASAFIYGFCMSPAFRGKGVGRRVLRQTLEDLQNKYKASSIKLEVSVENEGALGLYQSCGFQTKNANDYYVILLD
ncbi:GNAT family N-acetyltransferase [Paenibacillus sp. SYP-B3998]|uniref:GNAT family N-acetyltransferase n=1 Tax=Paenibacillus sp. SYP-B3998 TaxID=2678564 RepID=A0A6G3ZZA6_9BACL|nr:GNAT family N-acetyltransferase [Paenibacillus sp. SYP-B3998]NEW07543.1 GNAT family N-acetyltransferase [Paenibacillus sp. SYP-B3998]